MKDAGTIAMPGEPRGKGRVRATQPVTFVVRLAPAPGSDGVKVLRAVLKTLWRRHHIRCISAVEERADHKGDTPAAELLVFAEPARGAA